MPIMDELDDFIERMTFDDSFRFKVHGIVIEAMGVDLDLDDYRMMFDIYHANKP